jgi:hypothetical protein
MTYYETNQYQNPSLIYGEGLRVPNVQGSQELDGLFATGALGKRKSFDRVFLYLHSGSYSSFQIKCHTTICFPRFLRRIQEKHY